jgi:hypothetical protein
VCEKCDDIITCAGSDHHLRSDRIEPGARCPTTYKTRLFFNKFTTNEDIGTKFEADLPHCVRNVTS